ncbi:MAG TPA: redoxin domain-containing protein [Thermodesulfobacteriota bacterium]|nr:redoxin domain-containing protein [Deltaproteobacteria bacterium]HLA51009.1 redoxin domain-containing protein [Thermodesulfobacteriota bacterium]
MENYIRTGQMVENFEMEVYDPVKRDFGKISLEEVKTKRRWMALVFYPADFTFICPTELNDLAEKHKELKAAGCEVVSVSTDTKFSHLAWQQSERLLKGVKYLMAADPTGKVSRMFGVYDEATGLALRGSFLINPDGKLVASEVNFYNVGRNASELLRKVKANVYAAIHTDEVCPANWTEGEKTLKPSANLVGKVYEAIVS